MKRFVRVRLSQNLLTIMFFKVIYYGLLLFLIAVGGLFVASYVGVGGLSIKIVQSGSMEPAIKTGSIVVVKPAETYAIGDIITFGEDTRKKVPTTHRILDVRAIEGGYLFTTKGDANEDTDTKEVRSGEIIGKVQFAVPYVGYVIDFTRKPLGFILLVGVPAAVIIFDELGSIFGEARQLRLRKRRQSAEGGSNERSEGTSSNGQSTSEPSI